MDDEIEEGMVVDDDIQAVPDNDQQRERKPEKSPHELLKESKGSVEEIVAQILSVKRQGLPKAELRELVTQMFVHFVTLRQVNRSILLEEDRVKSETERAKAPVDFATLQLHNLMYEKTHYIKAIKTCKDFKSKYPDIELVPEEEFFRDAPEEIKGSVTANETHDLMLRRLNFELFQRKELCKLHEQLEQRKKVLEEGIANRKKFLSSLPSHLKSLRKASLPVQNQLGIQHTKKMKQHNLAELLPPPLYVIYSQLMAQKEAFEENIDLEIVGSLKDAQAFVRQQANKDSGSSNLDSSKMEEDAPDDEDDGQRRRKRTKNVPAKENIEQSGLYQIHPLKVILHVFDDEASDPKPAKLVTLKFEHMPKLNVVTVGVEGSNEGPQDNILCNLFPDDTGRDLPHQSAKLAIGDSLSFDQRRTSRPYKWVQHLAGIDFLPEMSPLLKDHETSDTDITRTDVVSSGLTVYRQQNRVETILQRIRSRKKAQLALMEQLHSLEKLHWPALDCKNVPWAHHRFSCKLHGWSAVRSTQNHLSLAPPVDSEQGKEIMDTGHDESSVSVRDETESAREDGELPSLVHAAVNDTKFTPRGSRLGHTRQLALMAKSISPMTKSKALSFKKQDDELDILLDLDSDLDEPSPTDQEMEDAAAFQIQRLKSLEKAWFNYGVKVFCLVLTSKVHGGDRILKLEAKIKISMEYPLRPPYFLLSIEYGSSSRGNRDSGEDFQWSDKLRAIEAEVNLNIFKILPVEQENKTLAHQVHFLGMMLDYLVDEMSPTSEKSEATSIIDVGLCKPVSGKLLARSVRGRDRRKIIPWKH